MNEKNDDIPTASGEHSVQFILRRQQVPGDGSCLFNALNFLINDGNFDVHNADNANLQLRHQIAHIIEEQPDIYTGSVLGRPPEDYVQWIRNTNSWGGAIEIGVFAEAYQIEVRVLNLTTGRIIPIGPSNATRYAYVTWNRTHFEPIYLQNLFTQNRTAIFERGDYLSNKDEQVKKRFHQSVKQKSRTAVAALVNQWRTRTLTAPVIISYRNDQGNTMHGAFFDHYVIRNITQHNTVLIRNPTVNTNRFIAFIGRTHHSLTLNGVLNHIPQEASIADSGLLFIPGHPRNAEETQGLMDRNEFEEDLFQLARLRGQPILAVCGGCWILWRFFGGRVVPVTDHSYSKTPSIKIDGDVAYNMQIHRIDIKENTMLSQIIYPVQNIQFMVNSVHWDAPHGPVPDALIVSATAVQDAKIAPRSRQSHRMRPTNNSIEAFETIHGAPVMGIQWHPEAYYPVEGVNGEFNSGIVQYMVRAGDAYLCKRLLLVEFIDNFVPWEDYFPFIITLSHIFK
ncbi:unnamed protein product [Adineta steineri]|uniref:Ubiquitin thioesterase OTU n=1 Tax=Adineta steineri TaxID=433720 RepID=A0A815QHC9_9BILA|nr:unnamed protein product [Adineta steineri]CAF1633579.1 unnamed protein product [Adineta steineri]